MGEARWCEDHNRWECVHRKHGGGQCHGTPRVGRDGRPLLDSCQNHAGSKERIAYAKALQLRPGGHFQPRKIHPAEALLEEVWHHAGMCAWLDGIVAALERGEMTWGITRRRVTSGADGATEAAEWETQLNIYVQWAAKEHAAKAQVSRMALEALAEDTMVRLAERQATHLAGAWERGLARLDLTEEQWAKARLVYPELLAELAA